MPEARRPACLHINIWDPGYLHDDLIWITLSMILFSHSKYQVSYQQAAAVISSCVTSLPGHTNHLQQWSAGWDPPPDTLLCQVDIMVSDQGSPSTGLPMYNMNIMNLPWPPIEEECWNVIFSFRWLIYFIIHIKYFRLRGHRQIFS